LSKGRNFVRHCCRTGNIGAKNGKNVEATFDFVERIDSLVAFDNVASTLLPVRTGLKEEYASHEIFSIFVKYSEKKTYNKAEVTES